MIIRKNNDNGFTIIELLVVIVVIGILAAITIVSYSGIRVRAVTSAIKSQLINDSKLLKMYYIDNSLYPTALDSNYCPTAPAPGSNYCLKSLADSTLTYSSDGNSFILTIKDNSTGVSYSITENGDIAQVVTMPSTGKTFVSAWNGGSWPYANGAASLSDGYALTGTVSNLGAGNDDAFIAKYDLSGELSWSKTWGGSGWDTSNAISKTSEGGFAIVGRTTSFGAGGGGDVFLANFDSNGNLLWDRTWGGSGYDMPTGVTQTTSGDLVVTGYYQNGGAGEYLAFILKYDSDGDFIWNKTWGGTNDDRSESITKTADGGFAIAGSTHSFGFNPIENQNGFVAKFDSDGNLLWDKTIDQGDGGGYIINSIHQTSDGTYVIVGNTPQNDSFISKIDSNGALFWSRVWGGADNDTFRSVVSSDDGYVITGRTRSYGNGDYLSILVKFSKSGDLIWNSALKYQDVDMDAFSVDVASDGGFVISGRMGAAYISKFDSTGQISGCGVDFCESIAGMSGSIELYNTDPEATVSSPDVTKTDPDGILNSHTISNNVIVPVK